MMVGKLALADGTEFLGESFGALVNSSGEVVFNTSMVGYPESLTDPSYFGQILILTYPLIGNYGIPEKKFWESEKIQVKGLIVQNYIDNPSHFESNLTLGQWLKKENIPALSGIDTRELTRKLRYKGVMLGEISHESKQKNTRLKVPATSHSFYDPNKDNVLPFVSVKKIETQGDGKKHIVLIDCGAKDNILRSLLKRKIKVSVVPWDFDPLKNGMNFDGVLVSNGPGDPQQAKKTILTLKNLISQNVPTFGICLGSQLLALAAEGNTYEHGSFSSKSEHSSMSATYKLKFGHRGQNQPVMDVETRKAIITSQNHGYAVNVKALSSDWEEWFVNLNDGSNEGIRHKKKPFFAAQFHPEASPGPVDASYLFDEFISFL